MREMSQKGERILLLHPFNEGETYHYAIPQVALGYLSAALKKKGYSNIDIQDAHVNRWTVDDFVRYLERTRPDVVGIRMWSHQVETVNTYLVHLRKILPHAIVIAGGPHITVMPEYIGFAREVDYGIAGEAERSLPMVLDHVFEYEKVDLSKVPGLILCDGDELNINPVLKDPDLDLYEVDWQALNLGLYHTVNSKTTAYDNGQKKNAFIFTTRGCPYPCAYCAAGIVSGTEIRSHTGERMMRDISTLYHDYGVRHFNIMDDNFTFYKETVMDFCESFLRRKDEFKDVSFHNPNGVRVDRLDNEMLAIMKQCGWRWLHIGIESASPNILRKMKKRLNLDTVSENVAKIRKHGLKCWGLFILGYPGETLEDMEMTIDFAVRSKLHGVTFSLFSPIPGTEVYKNLVAEGRIPTNYNMSAFYSPEEWVFAEGVTCKKLQSIQRQGLIRFFKRPDRAYYLLKDMDFATFANRFKTIFIDPVTKRLALSLQ